MNALARLPRWPLVGLLLLALGAACSLPFPVAPADAILTCDEDGACPPGTRCHPTLGQCFSTLPACATEEGLLADGTICELGSGKGDDGRGICLSGSCVVSACGDGFTDLALHGEECDDGNDIDGDECTNACTLARCGDGVVQVGVEVCDDGNTESGDGCRADCGKEEICGDGFLDEGEECDDGNDNPLDACDACRVLRFETRLLTGLGASGGLPLDEVLNVPKGIAVAPNGDIYVSDTGQHRVLRLERATGVVTIFAGMGVAGFSGDGVAANESRLSSPRGLAVDGLGDVYIADSENNRVRRVRASTGVIETVAGNGMTGPLPGEEEVVSALEAPLAYPTDVVVDGEGTLYVAVRGHSLVARVIPGGLFTPVLKEDSQPEALALSPEGVLYASHSDEGGGQSPSIWVTPLSDLGSKTQIMLPDPYRFRLIQALHWHEDTLYASLNRPEAPGIPPEAVLVALTLEGGAPTVTPLAGGGTTRADGPANEALLSQPMGLAADLDDGLLFVDAAEGRVRHLSTAGEITTRLGELGNAPGDHGAALSARLASLSSVDVNDEGSVLVSEIGEGNRLRFLDASTGLVRTLVGNGAPFTGVQEGSPARTVDAAPAIATWDGANVVYYFDKQAKAIMRLDLASDAITHFAGDPALFETSSGDGGPARLAGFMDVVDLELLPDGRVLVLEYLGLRLRVIDPLSDTIDTFAGTGACAPVNDGAFATEASLCYATDVAVDEAGNVYIADGDHLRVRRIDAATGRISTIAGNGSGGLAVTGPATEIATPAPRAVAVTPDGEVVYIAYQNAPAPSKLEGGMLSLLMGGDGNTQAGDGAHLEEAGSLGPIASMTVDAAGNLYIAERAPIVGGVTAFGLARVRRVSTDGSLHSVMGLVDAPNLGPLARSSLQHPAQLIALEPGARWLVASGNGDRVLLVDAEADEVSAVAGYPNGFEPGNDPLADERTVRARFGPLLRDVAGIAYDPSARVAYLSERGRHLLWRMDVSSDERAEWTLEPFAGEDGVPGWSDGALDLARFEHPAGLAYSLEEHTLYVADSGNQVVRRVDLTSETVTTVAGTPSFRGFRGDGTSPEGALLNEPEAVALGNDGSLYIADTGNHRVRRVDFTADTIHTVIGDGTPSSAGQGAPAAFFPIDTPRGVAVDAFGNLYASSSYAVRQVFAGDDGIATPEDEVRTIYGAPPRDLFPASSTRCLSGVSVETREEGPRVLVLDGCLGYLLELEPVRSSP